MWGTCIPFSLSSLCTEHEILRIHFFVAFLVVFLCFTIPFGKSFVVWLHHRPWSRSIWADEPKSKYSWQSVLGQGVTEPRVRPMCQNHWSWITENWTKLHTGLLNYLQNHIFAKRREKYKTPHMFQGHHDTIKAADFQGSCPSSGIQQKRSDSAPERQSKSDIGVYKIAGRCWNIEEIIYHLLCYPNLWEPFVTESLD